MTRTPTTRRPHRNEEGYVLVAVVFMMVILILSLSIAVPKVRESIQRDREEETMQRGKQYIRAIQLYYRKFHAYPPNIDALVKTNDIRFLRKRYIDPMTGKDDWKPILWGQNKTPMAMGFFGQPLAAGFGGGIGPSGGNTPGGIAAGGGPFGGPASSGGIGTPTGGGLFNSNPTSTTDSGTSGTTPQVGAGGSDNSSGSSGTPTSSTGTGTSSSISGFGSTSSTNNPTGSGQAFGGGGIIGFSPASPKQSILIYKKKNHYNEWEFLYSPLMDQQQMAGGNTGTIGQPAGSTTPIGGGGTNPTTTTPPATPTTPTTPQQ